nr:Protein UGT-15 [Haemonchus contortus]
MGESSAKIGEFKNYKASNKSENIWFQKRVKNGVKQDHLKQGRIADILHEAGHDVTVLHPIWQQQSLPQVANSAKKILFPLPQALTEELQPDKLRVWDTNSRSIVDQLRMLAGHTLQQIRTCDILLGDNATMQMLANERFDAGITEMLGACGFGLFDVSHQVITMFVGVI